MLAARYHGSGLGGGLLRSVLHGFAWSVGWMIARGLGLPAAAVVLALLLGGWWWRFRVSGGRGARDRARF